MKPLSKKYLLVFYEGGRFLRDFSYRALGSFGVLDWWSRFQEKDGRL